MVSRGLLVRLEARPGMDDDVEDLLRSALPMVRNEAATTAWFAIRFGRGEYGIFDVFPDDAGRDAHLAGPVAKALIDHADALFTLHGSLEDGQRYYADVKGRAASYGRNPDQLKVFPAATFVLGDTAEEAADKAVHIRHQQVSGATAIAMLEQVWGRDLSGYDPDGPLPDVDPTGDTGITQGRVRHGDPVAVARRFRERAEAEKLSIRELIIAVTSREQFVGTAAHIADEIDRYVQADACDGFILVPHLTPHGLDDFVDQVVPLLQERGAFRAEYGGHTLREHLGLTA